MRSAPQLTGVKGGLALSDGLMNVVTGFGTARDKNAFNRYTAGAACVTTQHEVEAAYTTSWLVRKVHDLPPFDMTRAGRDWQAKKDQIEKLEAEETRLSIWFKAQRALLLARAWGGGALILGANQGQPNQELRPEGLRAGGLQFVHVVSRYQLTYRDINMDPMSPFFGEPEMWQMSSGGGKQIDIHPSRVIPFVGQRRLEGGILSMGQDRFWGDPLLASIRDATVNADLGQAAVAALLNEAKTDTLSVPDMMSQMGTAEYEQRFMRRLEVANTAKSMMNTRLIDAAEKWETQQVNFSALPDVMRMFLLVASGAADIPATRLLGQSPAGQNATGESDIRNYYDMLSARQNTDLKPQLARLDALLIPSALGSRPDEVHWKFAPLWQLSEPEQADVDKKNAETDQIYASSGLLPIDALATGVQNRLIENAVYPGLDQALETSTAELEVPEVTDPANEDDPSALTQPPKRQAANDAAPRTLYVSRKLLNAADLVAWAKGQGIETTLAAADMHVTVVYSRASVDWLKMGTDWSGDEKGWLRVPAGGPRVIERLGADGKALTLAFSNESLEWRHKRFVEAGCSWDWPEFQPHVTISYNADEVDASKLEAYQGPLVFGPEVFAEVKEDWSASISEV